MKKTVLNGTGGLLIALAFVLLFCESDFKTVSEVFYFLIIKVLGFGFGYVGFKIIEVQQDN